MLKVDADSEHERRVTHSHQRTRNPSTSRPLSTALPHLDVVLELLDLPVAHVRDGRHRLVHPRHHRPQLGHARQEMGDARITQRHVGGQGQVQRPNGTSTNSTTGTRQRPTTHSAFDNAPTALALRPFRVNELSTALEIAGLTSS